MISARAVIKCSLLCLACCSSSSSSDPQPTPPPTEQPKGDGGLPGTSSDLKISTPQKFRVSQQRQNVMTVNLERFNNPAVQLTVEGLPKGVTAKVAPIDALATSATIVFEADDSSTQDTKATVNVVGEAAGSKVTVAVELRITGAPGTFDKSFGVGGRIQSYKPFPELSQGGTVGVAVEPDNRFLVLWSRGGGDFSLQRFSTDGSPDPTFNGGALLTFTFRDATWTGSCVMTGLVRQADGKYLLYGYQRKSDGLGAPQNRVLLLRLNGDGTGDSTYGDGVPMAGGKFYSFDTSASPISPFDMARSGALLKVGADEELVVSGRTLESGLVVQFDTHGNLSQSFHSGTRYIGPPPPGNNPPQSYDAVVSNGQQYIVAVGSTAWGSFGSQGPLSSDSQRGTGLAGAALNGGAGFFADNTVFLLGTNNDNVGWAKYTYPGITEVSGYRQQTSSDGSPFVAGVHVMANKQVLVAVHDNPAHGATFMRINSDGALDTSFGEGATPGRAKINLWDTEADLFLLSTPTSTKTAVTNDDRVIISTSRFYGRIWN